MRPNPAQAKSNLSFLKGSAALEREEYKLAEVGFAQALHEDPNNTRAMIFLLYAQLKRRPTLRLVDGLQTALKMAPQDTLVLRTAAKVHVILDQAGKAIALLEKARSIDPNDPETQAELAEGYLSLRKRAECEAAFKEALRLAPDHPLALSVKRSFAKVYFDAAPAQRAEEQPLRKQTGTVDSHLADAKAALTKNEVAEAYWRLREALRLNPKSLEAQEALTAMLRRRFPLYDKIYRFSLTAVRWHVVSSFLLVYVGVRLTVLAVGGSALPIWAHPALLAGVFAIVVIAALTLWPMPIVNFALRFHPIGRSTLTKVDRAENAGVVGTLVSGLASLLLSSALRTPMLGWVGAADLVAFAGLVGSIACLRKQPARGSAIALLTLGWVAANAWYLVELIFSATRAAVGPSFLTG